MNDLRANDRSLRAETDGESVGRLLLLASRSYSDRAITLMRERGHPGLAMTHAMILPHVDSAGTRLTALGDRAGITKQAAGQTVRDLERLGYVIRAPDPSDGRASLISLTRRGQIFLVDAIAIRTQIAAEFAAALGEEPLGLLRDILAALLAARPFAE